MRQRNVQAQSPLGREVVAEYEVCDRTVYMIAESRGDFRAFILDRSIRDELLRETEYEAAGVRAIRIRGAIDSTEVAGVGAGKTEEQAENGSAKLFHGKTRRR